MCDIVGMVEDQYIVKADKGINGLLNILSHIKTPRLNKAGKSSRVPDFIIDRYVAK